MKRLSLILPLLLLLIAPTAYAADVDPLDALLGEMIAEYGGMGNLMKHNEYVSTWEMDVQVRDEKGTATLHVGLPDRLRVVLETPGQTEIRVFNAGTGTQEYVGKGKKDVDGAQLDAMRLQLMRLYTPLVLKGLKRTTKMTLDRSEGYSIINLFDGNVIVRYFVNDETKHIEAVVGMVKVGNSALDFVTEYSDYTRVDGVLMHHSENKFANGVNTAKLRLKSIEPVLVHPEWVFK